MTTVIYPPTLPWSKLTQRPQQLMRCFARLGWSVVYHDPGSRRATPAVREIEPQLYLLSEYVRPDVLRKTVEMSRPAILWISYPLHANLVGKLYGEDLVVFDLCDMPSEEFSEWGKWMKEVFSKASVVFAASSVLYEAFSRCHPRIRFVPNGADWEHFSPLLKRSAPLDFPRRAGRVAGYHGALATWLDWTLIQRVAAAMPHWNFVFVGPAFGLGSTWLPSLPNVFFAGEKRYSELPSYVASFDVGIVPFEVREVTRASDPIKVYEYLAAGKPVVSTDVPSVRGRPGVYVARDADEFACLLERALAEDSEEGRKARLDFARENSWENRARHIMKEISDVLHAGVG